MNAGARLDRLEAQFKANGLIPDQDAQPSGWTPDNRTRIVREALGRTGVDDPAPTLEGEPYLREIFPWFIAVLADLGGSTALAQAGGYDRDGSDPDPTDSRKALPWVQPERLLALQELLGVSS